MVGGERDQKFLSQTFGDDLAFKFQMPATEIYLSQRSTKPNNTNGNNNKYDSLHSQSNYQDQFRFNNEKVVVFERSNHEESLPEDDNETSVEETSNCQEEEEPP